MREFLLLFRKDLTIEFRGRELLYSLLSLSVLIAVFFGVGIENAFLEERALRRIFPSLVWIAYIFASTISVSRSLYYEIENGALSSLITNRISLTTFYLAKVCSNTILGMAGFLCIAIALMIFINISLPFPSLLCVGSMVSIGYAALATLTSNMILRTKLRELLLPLILFPLLFPLFFAAHELTMLLVIGKTLSVDSPWFILLSIMDLLYLIAGSFLFPFAARG